MKFLIIVATLIFSSAAYADSTLICTVTRNPAGQESVIIDKVVVPFENEEASLSTGYPKPDARRYFASAKEGVVSLTVWTSEDFGEGAVSVEEKGKASLRLWFKSQTVDIACNIE